MIKKLQKNKRSISILVLIGLLSLIPVVPLWKEGFFISDDGEWMVIRFAAFYQTLRDGQFPPRFFGSLNHGYGYPIGTFLYPAFLYLATPFKLLGFSFSEAIKIVFIASFLFSGVGTYFWLRQSFSKLSAAVGSLIYVYFPYHLYDLYIRGSIGELVSFAVLPFFLFAIDKKRLLIASFLLGFLLLSHNTFALLLLPFLVFYVYLCGQRRQFLVFPLGLLLSAFFWLPSITELSLTIFSTTVISQWEEYFITDKTWQMIGAIGVLLTGIAAYFLYRKKHTITLFFVVIFFIGLFFSSRFSSSFWELGVLPKLVQFPWRFLILLVWAGSFLAASMIHVTKGKVRLLASVVLLTGILISYLPYSNAYQSVIRDESYYFTNEDTTTVHNEYMPKTVRVMPLSHFQEKVTISQGRGTISNVVRDSYKTAFHLKAEVPSVVTIHTIYYPGWEARVNGMPHELQISPEGYLAIRLPKGNSQVTTEFGGTPLRLFADLLSVITAILLILVALLSRTKYMKPLMRWYNNQIWRKN